MHGQALQLKGTDIPTLRIHFEVDLKARPHTSESRAAFDTGANLAVMTVACLRQHGLSL